MDHLVHAHVMLGLTQKQRLREIAATRGLSMAAMVRDAIDHYLRVVAGPSPTKLRRVARDTVGVLPPLLDVSDERSADGDVEEWLAE